MSFSPKRKNNAHRDYVKAGNKLAQPKKRRINTILSESNHIKLKMIAATTGSTVSEILDKLATDFISDHGKIG